MLGLPFPEPGSIVGDYITPEQVIPDEATPVDWETCMTMNDTWGYKSWDHNWKSSRDLIRKLVDIASKGGNFLLNVGPTAEGLIPEPSVERLADIGKWMDVNGESIYGTTTGPLQNLEWGRTTRKQGKIYLHVFDWPDGELLVEGLEKKPGNAYMLSDSSRSPLSFNQSGGRLIIELPQKAPDPDASVIVLE
jgi:alpha-L-fucosidase